VLVSQYFVWFHIPVHAVEYDWQLLIVDYYIEYIEYVWNNVVSRSGQFGPSNLNGMWHK
jgi:hypothetical protein